MCAMGVSMGVQQASRDPALLHSSPLLTDRDLGAPCQ